MRMAFSTLQPDPYVPAQPLSPVDQDPTIWHHMALALHQSIFRVSSLLISILPGLLAFILAVGFMTGVGVLFSFLLRRGLTSAKFDERLARGRAEAFGSSGIADWSPAHSPTALLGRAIFWLCVLLGLIIGISAFAASYAAGSALAMSLLPYVTRSVGAILLLFAGNLIARFLARTVLIGAVNNQLQYARFLSMGVKWLMLVLTAAMVLDHLQIGGTIVELAFGILFGGIVLTLALAIGLGSRDLVTRSLEKTAEHPERPAFAGPQEVREKGETLRHF